MKTSTRTSAFTLAAILASTGALAGQPTGGTEGYPSGGDHGKDHNGGTVKGTNQQGQEQYQGIDFHPATSSYSKSGSSSKSNSSAWQQLDADFAPTFDPKFSNNNALKTGDNRNTNDNNLRTGNNTNNVQGSRASANGQNSLTTVDNSRTEFGVMYTLPFIEFPKVEDDCKSGLSFSIGGGTPGASGGTQFAFQGRDLAYADGYNIPQLYEMDHGEIKEALKGYHGKRRDMISCRINGLATRVFNTNLAAQINEHTARYTEELREQSASFDLKLHERLLWDEHAVGVDQLKYANGQYGQGYHFNHNDQTLGEHGTPYGDTDHAAFTLSVMSNDPHLAAFYGAAYQKSKELQGHPDKCPGRQVTGTCIAGEVYLDAVAQMKDADGHPVNLNTQVASIFSEAQNAQTAQDGVNKEKRHVELLELQDRARRIARKNGAGLADGQNPPAQTSAAAPAAPAADHH